MSESYFRFKQFSVSHDHCAMKVGTDGVLLGAWARVGGCRRVLDIGTGSGLIALMVAQRLPESQIVAIDIDADAVAQAAENVDASPFRDRISVGLADVRVFSQSGNMFDCIICNPPFFTEDTLPENRLRALARHSSSLSFDDLTLAVSRLISESGVFNVILPSNEVNEFVSRMFNVGMNLILRCDVKTVVRRAPKRTLMTFSKIGSVSFESEELVLLNEQGGRSIAYSELTRDFYLW